MQFASDEFYYALKAAQAAGERERMAELLWPHVLRSSRYWFAKQPAAFAGFTGQDREDAIQEAFLYVLQKIDDFLAQPGNDPAAPEQQRYSPAQKRSFFFRMVYNGLRRAMPQVYKHMGAAAIDGPVRDGAQQTLGDTLPSTQWAPERIALARDELHAALRDFFRLPNAPETLVSIAYVILNDAMGEQDMTLEDYAAFLNGKSTGEVALRLQALLQDADVEAEVLAPVLGRMEQDGPRIEGVTAKKLANRKNSILDSMRKGRDPDDG